ncbi:MAG: DUF3644 domain-containing protein [Nostoc sp. JL31]|uniref:DUF3644 domain-containing protein n=1 Tax=Nostoc sp. JL31 TaxID=2815395 RepID=UPI0025DA6578|nr:DUF3644 domain-containing protein [Nostoc sp. JL31]MBN3891046.1 DUF3644 domain-containing protein [Nostoc sp. JL31]
MNSYSQENNFVLTLEGNAIDSLVHAVEHFLDEERPTYLKYAILHVFHAVELFLKARLAKIDPELIFEKQRKDGSRFTISVSKARECLEKEGIIFSTVNKNNLDALQVVRNQIEHYRFSGNREDIINYVGQAMYFLESFLKTELEISLKKELDAVEEGVYETLSRAYLFYIKRMLENGIELHPRYKGLDGTDFVICPNCEEETVVIPDPTTQDDSVHCFLCHTSYSFFQESCLRCESISYSLQTLKPGEKFTIQNSDDWYEHGFCEICLEDIQDE